MFQYRAPQTSGVKTPAFPELFGTAEAVPSRQFLRSKLETAALTKLRLLATMDRPPGQERRGKARLKLPQVVRVRPSDPRRHEFDEILPTTNISRDSVYFASKNGSYAEGMRLFVTYPYSDAPGALNREYVGKVLRIDDLGHGRRGIAVQLLMPLYLGGKETVR